MAQASPSRSEEVFWGLVAVWKFKLHRLGLKNAAELLLVSILHDIITCGANHNRALFSSILLLITFGETQKV